VITAFMESQVHPYGKTPDGKTPDDISPGHIGDACAMEGSDSGSNIADRIALAAAVAAAILILVMFELTDKPAMQPVPAAAAIAISPYVGLHVFKPDRLMPRASATAGRD
jgi:hypothetical protein